MKRVLAVLLSAIFILGNSHLCMAASPGSTFDGGAGLYGAEQMTDGVEDASLTDNILDMDASDAPVQDDDASARPAEDADVSGEPVDAGGENDPQDDTADTNAPDGAVENAEDMEGERDSVSPDETAGTEKEGSGEEGFVQALDAAGAQAADYAVKAPSIKAVECVAYNQLKISWTMVKEADGYYLLRSSKENGSYKLITETTAGAKRNYTDQKRKAGTTFYYKVCAYRIINGEKVQGELSDAVSGMTVPGQVTGLTAKAINNNRVSMSWNKVKGAQSYIVMRSLYPKKNYEVVKKNLTKLTYIDKNLEEGQKYYYRICAVRNDTPGEQSEKAGATTFKFGLSTSSVSLIKGATQKVKATVTDGAAVNWASKNTAVARVNANGKIKGVKPGNTTITATSHGVTLKVKVSVTILEYGIDVSHWQGTINWNSVRASGYSFVMLKATQGTTYTDPTFSTNYNGAKAAGLKVGCYAYSVAKNAQEASAEANYLIRQLAGRKMDYPVVLDLEDSSILAATTTQQRMDIIFTYQSIITQAGYKFALYANLNWLTNYIDNAMLVGMDIWIARYRDMSLGHGYTGGGNVVMWQYTSSGSVNGISGNVDMNLCYKAY